MSRMDRETGNRSFPDEDALQTDDAPERDEPVSPALGAPWLNRWLGYLRHPVHASPLVFFRIAFGLILLIEVGRYFAKGWITRYYVEPPFHFSYLPFVEPWPGAGMYVHFALLGVLALFIAAGAFYRISATLFFVGFAYVFLLEKANYLNHFYLITLISFLMCFVPAHRCASVDVWMGRVVGRETVPRWSILILQLQIALVYFYGGIAKLNSDWLGGQPMTEWMEARHGLPLFGPYLAERWVVILLCWGGAAVDLAIPFLLFARRTFPLAVAIAFAFNLINAYLFSIGIFPVFMLASLVLFAPSDLTRRWLNRWRVEEKQEDARRPSSRNELRTEKEAGRSAVLAVLHVYVAFQLLIPFRHWFYPGLVHWSEEGHRFSWHMMLRSKNARAEFFVEDPSSPVRRRVATEETLTPRQYRKMASRPDMIRQWAHYVAEKYEERTGVRPSVYASVYASLNGRPYQPLVDESVDLAAQEWSWMPASWILPMKERD